jgi:hypothetical protein
MNDPIVEEVRRVREQNALKHQFNVKKIAAAARVRERASGRKIVSLARRPLALSAKG